MVFDESQAPTRGVWRRFFGQQRFTILLVFMVAMLALPPMLLGFGLTRGWFDALMLPLVLAAILSLCQERHERLFALSSGIPTILLSLVGYATPEAAGFWILFVGHLCGMLFLFGSAVLIVRRLFSSPSITLDSVSGAICGYLFLGLGWAVAYNLIESFPPGSFEINPRLGVAHEQGLMQPYLLTYYSFVTLTTVGYGDITPVSPVARTLSWIEAVTGQFYLTVIVAGLVGILITHSRRPPPESSDR
jgi:hypothetical protein